MKKRKLQHLLLSTGILSSLAIGVAVSTFLFPNEASALTNPNLWTKAKVGDVISLKEIGMTEFPTTVKWNSNSEIRIEKGAELGGVYDGYWGEQNEPPAGTKQYSMNPGDSYRITNVGTTAKGQALDLIITIKSSIASDNKIVPQRISILNGNDVGDTRAIFDGAITQLVSGTKFVSQNVKYVKSGTNEEIVLGTFAYWTDIDVYQGLDEKQSNKKAYFFDNSDLSVDGNVVYAPFIDDLDGNGTERGRYIGLGQGSNFDINFYAPYTGGTNVGVTGGDGFRFDILGKMVKPPVELIQTPPDPAPPVKTVTDGGKDINNGETSPDTHWIFDIAQEMPEMPAEGVHYESWVLTDDVPATAKILGTKMIDEQGNDVASKFDISVSGQKVTATAKKEALSNSGFYKHTYHLLIDTIVNIDDQNKTAADLKTDNVATSTVDDNPQHSNHVVVTPKFNEPSIKKSVAKDGTNWVTDEELDHHHQRYNYKIDYTLSDHADYTSIVLTDPLEDIQSVGDIKILDAKGTDVTVDWIIAGLPDENANKDGIKATANITATAKDPSKYTRVGGTYSMLLTDVTLEGAGAVDEVPYVQNGKEVIPNTAKLDWKDKTPDPNEPNHLDSNKTTVTPPKPTEVAISKEVSIDGGKTWGETKDLPNHDGNYTWRTHFTLSKMNNYDQLVLTDHFADVQFSNLDIAKMIKIEQAYTDITEKFTFSTKTNGNNVDVIATAKPEYVNDFDDITNDTDTQITMTITDVNLKKVSAKSEEKYIKDGVETIPNQSTINVNPGIKEEFFHQEEDSNIAKVNIEKPTVPTTGNPDDKNDKGKQVSIDGGKTWIDFEDLPTHDTIFDWKSTFNPSKFFNFDGEGSLVLTDHFENLQTIGKTKAATMTNEQLNELVNDGTVQLKDMAGKDVADKFIWTVKKGTDLQVDLIASVKKENADEFDDLGGVNQGDLQTLTLYVNQATLRAATGYEEINYLGEDNRVVIPNISSIHEDSGIDQFTGDEKTNTANVRLPQVDPDIEKYVEIDGDDEGQLGAIDENAKENEEMKQALEQAKTILNLVETMDEPLSDEVKQAIDNLVKVLEDVSSTVEEIKTATSALESAIKGNSETTTTGSESSSENPLTMKQAIEEANKTLARLDNVPLPYPDDVQTAKEQLVSVSKEQDVTVNQIQAATKQLEEAINKMDK